MRFGYFEKVGKGKSRPSSSLFLEKKVEEQGTDDAKEREKLDVCETKQLWQKDRHFQQTETII